ncbi:fimbrial protein [Pseudomonas aeruginosa]|uniref:fimbrial protein n=1 Tax=Pseudomonas aeruginosa TaxID=287 RepID=UPI000E693FB1|nr:fimbrial protein [Pseudomonas aeruginosa]
MNDQNTLSIRHDQMRPRALLIILLLLGYGWTEHIQAACRLQFGRLPPNPASIMMLPATTALGSVPIGGVMASYQVGVGNYAEPLWACYDDTMTFGMVPFTTTLKPIDPAQGLYESGVKGVGIRFKFGPSWTGSPWNAPVPLPFEYRTTSSLRNAMFPKQMQVEFIRTEMDVGRGEVPPFDLATTHYRSDSAGRFEIAVVGTQLKTTLTQNLYFTSCHNPGNDPVVSMGRPYAALIKQGQVEEHPFSLTIRCDGMNAATKPPVKIYFEGNAKRDGLLRLSGDGQEHVAKGVGIELKNSKGVDLPFAKARALALTWQSSVPDAEIYSFSGKARYVATGGDITGGKADATLTYVLEYN